MPRTSRGPRTYKRNGVYYLEAADGKGGKIRRSMGTRNKKEAEAKLGAYMLESGAEMASSPPVPVLLERYLESSRKRLISLETTTYAVRFMSEFFDCTADELTPPKLRSYYVEGRDVSRTTKAREMTVLRAALNYAVKEGWITKAPFVPVAPPAPPRDRWLTRSEAARLLSSSRRSPHLALFIRLGLYTAARSQAILDLKWSRVDLERGRIDYNPPGRARTSKGRVVVPIGGRLASTLRRAKQRADSEYVISWRGEPLKRIVISFRKTARRAGLKGVTPHTLRHTAATWMAQANVPIPLIAGMLGQSMQRTTERYIKHSPDYLAGAVAAVERGSARCIPAHSGTNAAVSNKIPV